MSRYLFASMLGLLHGSAPSSWECQVGQGGNSGTDWHARSNQNSEASCGAVCLGDSDCLAFDFTTTAQSRACRLYTTTDSRLGDGGPDHREYCLMDRAPSPTPPAPTRTRVLFVGNSFTYVHDMPRQFQHIAQSLGDYVEIAASTVGGCTLFAQQASLDNTTASLLEQDWDYIVLQDYSLLPTIAEAREVYLDAAVKDFASRKKQAKIVMYMTWGYHSGLEDRCPSETTEGCDPLGSLVSLTNCSTSSEYQDGINSFECMGYSLARGYFATKEVGADLVAPCGLAWQVLRGSTSIPAGCKAAVDAQYEQELPLQLPFQVQYGSDSNIKPYIKIKYGPVWDKHQSLAGCYLNALVFYATLFGKSTIGAAAPNASWGKSWGLADEPLTDVDLLTLQFAADGTVKQCGAACGLSSEFVV